MKIVCNHCGGDAFITSRNAMTTGYAELYCVCKDTKNCGASFVMSLAFKHYIQPPITSTQQLAAHVLKSLGKAEVSKLLQSDLFQ